ncbi:adventurous gliding motility protein AgmC [Hyalangium rubrum]|uniref:Hemagglutinin n=1 Tax=Hyalangium rubrum TaxID=3103134 RepID=A0ABU5HA03_9BACT|nr:hemagglutinin [Hyalangium sp. s54d21]MDY7230300.1 hemagglutinin [Hyalangium sp. s54d21]
MRHLRSLLGLGLLLASTASRAEVDVFGLGNGQHGALRVQRMDTIINEATALTAKASAGATALTVASESGFAAGELVLVLQVYAEGPAPTEVPSGPLSLSTTGAGRWEFARLESVASGSLRLTAPLVGTFNTPGAQVVRVPEYSSVHVQPGASLMATSWNGIQGGVLAFLSTGSVLNQGDITVEGAGFRGGPFATVSSRFTGCEEPNQSEETGGAHKGGGIFRIATGAFTHGYAALGNAGGGGNCQDAGGGGGGHGGAGGQGGYSTDGARDVGGRGGQALRYEPLSRMMFGGGGGAGAGNASGQAGSGGTAGGPGGGILYMRARSFQGSQGRVLANGRSSTAAGNDGAGGGGAGGHITLRVEGRLDCASLQAHGGNGGDSEDAQAHGPGGGGGGGVVLVQAETLACTATALPGSAGTAEGAAGGTYGATPPSTTQPENQGATTTLNEAFGAPEAPLWLLPAQGERTTPRPRLEGTARAGSTVSLFLEGALLGSVQASESGAFAFLPAQDLAEGPHEVRAVADRLGVRGALSEPRAFTVGAPLAQALEVGCGCGAASSAGGPWLAALGALLWASARRGRARRALGCPGWTAFTRGRRGPPSLAPLPAPVVSSPLMRGNPRRWPEQGNLSYTCHVRPSRGLEDSRTASGAPAKQGE